MTVKKKILYTDDSSELLTLYKNALSDFFEVITNDDPRKVIDIIKNERPEAVLLDVDMPFLNGLELHRQIHEMLPPSEIPPILFLSSFTDDNTVTSCFHVGADDFMSKGTSFAQIVARINAKLGRKKTFNSCITLTKDVFLDVHKKILYSKDLKIQLTPHEYKLVYFTSQTSVPISKAELIAKTWGETVVLEKTINTHLTNLRKKLRLVNLSINIKKSGVVTFEETEQMTTLFGLLKSSKK